ncbi:23S rRNA (cytidine(2498)-2'-O)-methyltransferase RlmM [Stigmatella sp. ncwal1]|uniref:23S rRNA (Cytidine(2498)-2'-O)-methyltransferase RlmM n=1 Tax=Stigmatella ashevillensis TaxID=2995309 RepID=A0ABT5D6W7_9BACT|nr:23S rRNA (cytidine(2498)-2'-O)-methyltransferase RlmM [Stigmatella ashevillena]MDC0709405.1 23S rRNA (cytidine(2498)-2'-O)-methyltransferase RlmM [Stigmatella ashevillena]
MQTLAPSPGRWLWTCRAGFEPHLYEELAWADAAPRLLGEALVESTRAPPLAPAFARQGMRVLASFPLPSPGLSADALARLVAAQPLASPLVLQAFTPDTPSGNTLAPQADALVEALRSLLPAERLLEDAGRAREAGARLISLCLAPGLAVLGEVLAREALSLAPGGRRRMRREADAPSRAAMKLEEALDGLPFEPGRGEVCVDLGAAPGGWTQRLVARGARVIAVDPAKLMPELAAHPRVRHIQESAFAFAPEEPVDWLFCDMAWRPLEVAQLLAKWGRRGWVSYLVANIKLPMKDKNPLLVRVRHILTEDGGWKGLTVRQLYHDRDEVTVTAHRR